MRGEDRERKPPLKQRPADDRPFAAQPLDRGEICTRPDASGCEHGEPRPCTHAFEEIEIGPHERAVAVDRGAEETGDARS